MEQPDYMIKVFDDFKDVELKNAWIKLEEATDAFPQMYYEWIEPWWRFNDKGRKLYIITVIESGAEIVGIAPFCLENIYGFKILQSIPIHFNDRYDFIICENITKDLIFQYILDHINTFKLWNIVKISKVRSNYETFNFLNKKTFHTKILGNIIRTRLMGFSFEDFLMQMKRNDRGDYHRTLKRLNELGRLEFLILNAKADYLKYENDFRRIYELRWSNVEKLPKEEYYTYRRLAYINCCEKGIALFCVLKLNNEVIAYRLGFIYKKAYYDYKLSFNPTYAKFGLGSIITGRLIEKLIEGNVDYLDHGAGDYLYKRNWAPENDEQTNHEFYFIDKKIPSKIGLLYELNYKDHFRKSYYKIKKLISRII